VNYSSRRTESFSEHLASEISACWMLMRHDGKISGAGIRNHDLWMQKRVCYHYTKAPTFSGNTCRTLSPLLQIKPACSSKRNIYCTSTNIINAYFWKNIENLICVDLDLWCLQIKADCIANTYDIFLPPGWAIANSWKSKTKKIKLRQIDHLNVARIQQSTIFTEKLHMCL